MRILIQIFSVFLLGLIGGANPGPILTASFTEALRRGFLKSLRVIFMAMIAESIVAIFILILFFSIYVPQIIFYLISFIGAGVLIWLGRRRKGVRYRFTSLNCSPFGSRTSVDFRRFF